MKVEYISGWNSLDHLVQKIQLGIRDSALVVVKNLNMDGDAYENFLSQFGEASTQDRHNTKKYLIMGERDFSQSGVWFDKREELGLHVDGILNLSWKRKILPTTFIYGVEIDSVRGGQTYFHDVHDLYQSFLRNSEPNMARLADVWGVYHNGTMLDSPTVEQSTLRFSPWSGKPYMLVDEWFTETLSEPGLLERYREEIGRTYRHYHSWERNDLLVWSNETFIHGRTSIESGRRVMWRGIVWNGHHVPIRRDL